MSDTFKPWPGGARICRFAFCAAVLIGATAANWITPPPETQAPKAAPPYAPALHPPKPLVPQAGTAAPSSGGGTAAMESPRGAEPPLEVTQWGLRGGNGAELPATGLVPAGQPLTLWFTLAGDAAAVNHIRSRGRIAIEVHWARASSGGSWGAPNLVTRLSIGRPDLADGLAAEVRRTGAFAWHSWAEKDSLSPGRWSVTLTYPNGEPLACGNPPAPCRFSFQVG